MYTKQNKVLHSTKKYKNSFSKTAKKHKPFSNFFFCYCGFTKKTKQKKKRNSLKEHFLQYEFLEW